MNLVWRFKASRLGNYPNSFFVMCVLGKPNSFINVFLVGLSWVLWFVLIFFLFWFGCIW